MHSISLDGYSNTRAKASKYSVSNTRTTIQLLLEHGAFWQPDEARQIAQVRRSLLECEPDVTLEVVEGLMKHSACDKQTIHQLVRTPTMKEHLEPFARRFVSMGYEIRTHKKKAEDLKTRTSLSHLDTA